MEATFSSNQTAQADDGTNPYRTGGMLRWVAASDSNNSADVNLTSGSTVSIPAQFTSRSGAILTGANASGMTDTNVQTLLQAIYNAAGQYKTFDAIVGPDVKRAFTSLLSTSSLSTISNATNTLARGCISMHLKVHQRFLPPPLHAHRPPQLTTSTR